MALTRPTSAQINTTSSDFSDPLMAINKDQTGTNDKDIGFVFERGSDTNVAFIWDESADEFAIISTTETGTTNGNITINSYADLHIGKLISSGLNYPISDGTNGQVLSTDGNGNLTFVSAVGSPGGSDTQVQFNDNGSFAGSANLTFNGTTLTSTGFSGPLNGNADTASKWETARIITLSGDLNGNVSIDGSSNITLTATVVDNSHTHDIGNIDGLQSALNEKLDSSSYVASDILTKIKTVDGADSNLDADLLDGIHGSSFLRSDSTDTATGDLTFIGEVHLDGLVEINSISTIAAEMDSTTSTVQTAISSFETTAYKSGKFVIQALDSVSGEVHVTELLVVHNGITASATEYATIFTGNGVLASYDTDINSGNVRILATPTSSNSITFKVTKNLITE